jgi:hypothetical protein
VTGPGRHQKRNGFSRIFYGAETIVAVDQLDAAFPDVRVHEMQSPLAIISTDSHEVCSEKSVLALTAQTATVVVPGEVRTYVIEQQTPSLTFEGDVAIGTALPDTVEIHTVPDQPDYGYVVVNKKRVLVNPKTRAVIEVIE